MSVGGSAATVRLTFRALPAHVRTARLVAVTVARRKGWPESLLESVRQAVGEACTLSLRTAGRDDVITLEMDDAGPGLFAWVWPVEGQDGPERAELPWAVLEGLTDAASLEDRDGTSVLSLHWAS